MCVSVSVSMCVGMVRGEWVQDGFNGVNVSVCECRYVSDSV